MRLGFPYPLAMAAPPIPFSFPVTVLNNQSTRNGLLRHPLPLGLAASAAHLAPNLRVNQRFVIAQPQRRSSTSVVLNPFLSLFRRLGLLLLWLPAVLILQFLLRFPASTRSQTSSGFSYNPFSPRTPWSRPPLLGGGWCNNATTCLARTETRLGSSKKMVKQLAFSGIFSNRPQFYPDFYNWNRVKVRYCDGASFTGDVEAVFLHFISL